MTTSMRPLAVALYEWTRQHRQELPPFPSSDYLRTPYLPVAPCLPDSPKAQLKMAAVTWRTGVATLLGQEATANPKVHEANKLCVAQLAALGIPPAEWLLARIETYKMSPAMAELPYPPFGFVYSATALANALEEDYRMDKWLGSLATPRRYRSRLDKEAQYLWYKIRQAYVRREDTQLLLEQYRAKVAECRAHNEQAASTLIGRVYLGEFVW